MKLHIYIYVTTLQRNNEMALKLKFLAFKLLIIVRKQLDTNHTK